MLVYFELQDKSDLIEQLDGQAIGESAEIFASNQANNAYIDNDTETTYPDLCIDWADEEMPSAVINGNTVYAELIGGLRPPQRPR